MLYVQHILYALLCGTGIVLAAYGLGLKPGKKLAIIFILSIVISQHLDIDHYADSFVTLGKCALTTDSDTYKSNSACMDLHRGVFHQARVGFFLFALCLGWLIDHPKRLAMVWIGSMIIFYAFTQQFFLEASIFYLIGLLITGISVRSHNKTVGAILIGLLNGWTLHMFLDQLLNFWFTQVI